MNKKLRITVEGKTYEVLVEMQDGVQTSAAPRAVAAPVAAAVAAPAAPVAPKPVAPAAGGNSVASPLAAVVVSIDVKEGQQVNEGDKLITLEAMKMNTFVFAPRAGTVGKIYVSAGQSVQEGEALVDFA